MKYEENSLYFNALKIDILRINHATNASIYILEMRIQKEFYFNNSSNCYSKYQEIKIKNCMKVLLQNNFIILLSYIPIHNPKNRILGSQCP